MTERLPSEEDTETCVSPLGTVSMTTCPGGRSRRCTRYPTRWMAYHPLWLAYLSAASLQASRIDEARQLIERALDLSRAQKERGSHAWALLTAGEIATRHERSHSMAVSTTEAMG